MSLFKNYFFIFLNIEKYETHSFQTDPFPRGEAEEAV